MDIDDNRIDENIVNISINKINLCYKLFFQFFIINSTTLSPISKKVNSFIHFINFLKNHLRIIFLLSYIWIKK